MPRCCGGATCSCVIHGGAGIVVLGTGQVADPYVIAADVGLAVTDSPAFDLILTGIGTLGDPWTIEAHFSPTAKLGDLPGVSATAPTDGQVLGYDSGTDTWGPVAPTTAAPGAVSTNTSLLGDGSIGNPLRIQENPDGLLATGADGLGLSDEGLDSVVRRFADPAARDAAIPVPTGNALSILGSVPGQIDYWTGAEWAAAGMFGLDAGPAFYEMSGPYTGAQRLSFVVRNVETTTDPDGTFDILTPAELAGKAGVLTASVQATAPDGPGTTPVPFSIVLSPDAGGLRGTAYRLDDGQPMSTVVVAFTVTAVTY